MEEKLKNVFDKEYSENRLTDFLIKTQKVYEFFEYDFKLKPTEIVSKDFYGGKVWLNHRFRDKFVEDILHFNFERLFRDKA